MPVYNGATFLEEAAQSVVDQTFTNWELIIMAIRDRVVAVPIIWILPEIVGFMLCFLTDTPVLLEPISQESRQQSSLTFQILLQVTHLLLLI